MENKNLNEQMARILNGLNDEQKEKAMACKTLDELMSLLSELRIAIPDELLDDLLKSANTPWAGLARSTLSRTAS